MRKFIFTPILVILMALFFTTSAVNGAQIESQNSSIWNLGFTWVGGAIPTINDTVTIKSGHNVIVANSVECAKLNIENGASLTVYDKLKVQGSIFVDTTGKLESFDNSILFQVDNVPNTGQGEYVYIRTGTSLTLSYNVWGSPVSNALLHGSGNSGVFGTNNPCDMFVYDSSIDQWRYDFSNGYSTTCAGGNPVTFGTNDITVDGVADGIADVGRGYFLTGEQNATSSSGQRSWTGGVYNNGTINIPVYGGDELISNPYPSQVNVTDFFIENQSTLSGGIYFWDDDNSAGAGYSTNDYAVVSPSGSVSGGNDPSLTNLSYIPAAQGFFCISTGSGNVTFKNSMRKGNDNSHFFKQANMNAIINDQIMFYLQLKNEGNGNYHQTTVEFRSQATDTFDYFFDVMKIDTTAEVAISTYAVADTVNETKLSINSDSLIKNCDSVVVQMSVNLDTAKFYSISLENIIDVTNEHYKVFLHDKCCDKTIELGTNGVYAFNTDNTAAKLASDRFELIFYNDHCQCDCDNGDPTSIDDKDKKEQRGADRYGYWFDWEGANFRVYNIGGVVVMQDRNRVNIEGLKTGIYIVVAEKKGEVFEYKTVR